MIEECVECVETVALANGLELGIYDKSRAVAGDTWLVAVLFRVEIGVDERLFEGLEGAPEVSDVISAIGKSVIFEVRQERNFINVAQREFMFKNLKETYLKNTLSYFSHPMFGAKYVIKKYYERMKYSG